jgi:hypothetical protein
MGVKQTQNHITHAAETRHRAQVLRWMLGQGTSRPKRVDRDAKQRQHAREAILLGECRFRHKPSKSPSAIAWRNQLAIRQWSHLDQSTMKAEIKSISMVGGELANYWPVEEDKFVIGIDLTIGPEGEKGGDFFSVQVCSPKWLIENCKEPIFCRNLIVMNEYDNTAIKMNLVRVVSEVDRPTWHELALYLARYFHWEFEDYSRTEDIFYAPSFPFGMWLGNNK